MIKVFNMEKKLPVAYQLQYDILALGAKMHIYSAELHQVEKK
jgi:hypothetical protein